MAVSGRDKARKNLTTKAMAMQAKEFQAIAAREAWEDACLDGYVDGLSYAEIGEISGLSRVRIDQVLRKARIRHGIKVNTVKKPAKKKK